MPDETPNQNEEQELREVVNRPPILSSAAVPPEVTDPYQGGTVIGLGLNTDTANSQLPGSLPTYRVMPVPVQGNPASNAGIQSTAQKVVNESTSTGTITLDVPNIFTPTTQTVTLPGPLVINLAVEPANTVFAGPASLASGAIDAVGTSTGDTNSISSTATPSSTNDLAFFIVSKNTGGGGVSTGPDASWTLLLSDSGNNFFLYDKAAGAAGTPVTALIGQATAVIWAAATVLVSSNSGVAPTIVNSASVSSGIIGTGTYTHILPFTPTNGNLLLIVITSGNPATPAPSVSGFSDTNNNTWAQLVQEASSNSVPTVGAFIAAFAASNIVGGSDTISFNTSGALGSGDVVAIEISGAGTVLSAVPTFRKLVSQDLPPVDISGSNVTGVLPLAHGGTDSNLSATGGTSQYLQQLTAGAAITVAQPVYNDLGGKASSYNGGVLVSNGFPGIIDQIDSVALTANVGLANLIASVPANGMFRISFYEIVQVAAGVSSTLPDVNFQWTDGNNTTLQSATFNAASASGNTLTTLNEGSLTIYARVGTAVQYQTGDSVAYASSGAPVMSYNLHIKCEQL